MHNPGYYWEVFKYSIWILHAGVIYSSTTGNPNLLPGWCGAASLRNSYLVHDQHCNAHTCVKRYEMLYELTERRRKLNLPA
jgi:hypothetical protein